VEPYPLDLPYPAHVHREASPAWIRAATIALGQRAGDPARALRYLDLGCGNGLGTALLAAANPGDHFTGIDLNAHHIAEGRALAGALPNLHLAVGDFAGVAEQDGAPFDLIVAHGVYSWIAPAQQAALRRIVARRLAPGGICYLHYSTHPGQSALAGAQALLRRVAAGEAGSAAGLARGLAAARALAAGGAGYFAANPAVAQLLADDGRTSEYLAHDLLPAHRAALHVAEVIDDMTEAGCTYLGSATLVEDIDALSLPAGTLPVIAAIREVRARETARDLARNQGMRRDLYRSGWDTVPPGDYLQQLAALGFVGLPALAQGDGGLDLPHPVTSASLPAEQVAPVRSALRRGPVTPADCAPLSPPQVLRTLLALTHAGEAHPLAGRANDPSPAYAFNARMAARGTAGWLAAPAIGSALPMDEAGLRLAGALLRDPGLTGPALLHAGRLQADPAALARFEAEVLPCWRALGIVPPAPRRTPAAGDQKVKLVVRKKARPGSL
jgi:SAM-dependent methyltransferase